MTSFIRTLDLGGMIWASADDYPTFDAAPADLELRLGKWLRVAGRYVQSAMALGQ